jgi:hypothetical protein
MNFANAAGYCEPNLSINNAADLMTPMLRNFFASLSSAVSVAVLMDFPDPYTISSNINSNEITRPDSDTNLIGFPLSSSKANSLCHRANSLCHSQPFKS